MDAAGNVARSILVGAASRGFSIGTHTRSERRSMTTLMLYRRLVCYFDGFLVSTLILTAHLRKLRLRSAVVQCRCASPLVKPRTVSTSRTSRPEHSLLCPRSPRAIAYMQGATTAAEHDAWHFPNAKLHARTVAGAVAPAVAPQVAPAAE